MGGITITLGVTAAVICPVGGLTGGGLLGLFCSHSLQLLAKGKLLLAEGKFYY